MFAWLCCAVAPQCEPGRSFACSLLRRHTAPTATDAAVGHCICAMRLPWGRLGGHIQPFCSRDVGAGAGAGVHEAQGCELSARPTGALRCLNALFGLVLRPPGVQLLQLFGFLDHL